MRDWSYEFMNKVVLQGSMLLIAVALLVSGCGQNKNGESSNPSNASASAAIHESPEASPSAPPIASEPASSLFEPITIEDASGETIEIKKQVEKIVCIVAMCVDLMAELDLEPVAIGESGVRTIASAPEFYGSKGESFTSIGGSFFEPNLEDIVTAAPDLVIGLEGVHEPLADGLKGVSQLYLVSPNSYAQAVEELETIGKITGKTAEAEASKSRFLDKLAKAKELSPKNKKALIMYGSDVNFGIVTATGIGGTVLKEVTDYPWTVSDPAEDAYGEGAIQYSLEKVLEQNPDVLFIESYSYSPGTKSLSEQLAASPLWSKLQAVQNKQVYEVRSPIWGDGRGTRSLGILLDESMKILYPDQF
jgi:iron complex transport system substrate-binding protein